MSEALSDDAQSPLAPEPGERLPISPSVQGMAPAWEPVEHISTPAIERHVIEAARGLSLEHEYPHEDRNGMTGAAERIGSAVGSAQRQVRRGLELVSSGAAHLSHIERERLDRAASTLQDISGEATGIRHQAARQLDEWSAEAGERLQQMSSAPSRWRARTQQLAAQYPLQTIAAIAGVSFAAGVALRLSRRSHRG